MLNSDVECAEKLEIFNADLLDQNKDLVQEFLDISTDLDVSYGWHYFLDFVWTVRELGDVNGKVILDAGASTGLLQWWLASKGATVISVDLEDRTRLDNRFTAKYRIRGMRKSDYCRRFSFKEILPSKTIKNWTKYPQKIRNFILGLEKVQVNPAAKSFFIGKT